jgi:hypothetical protein
VIVQNVLRFQYHRSIWHIHAYFNHGSCHHNIGFPSEKRFISASLSAGFIFPCSIEIEYCGSGKSREILVTVH